MHQTLLCALSQLLFKLLGANAPPTGAVACWHIVAHHQDCAVGTMHALHHQNHSSSNQCDRIPQPVSLGDEVEGLLLHPS